MLLPNFDRLQPVACTIKVYVDFTIVILAMASLSCDRSFIVLVLRSYCHYDPKSFIVQATGMGEIEKVDNLEISISKIV